MRNKFKVAFNKMHSTWEKYRQLEAKLYSLQYEGGSSQPYTNLVTANDITARRVQELSDIYNNFKIMYSQNPD